MHYGKRKEKPNFNMTVMRILVISDNNINFTIEQASGYMPRIISNWHSNTLMTLGHLYQLSLVNIGYAYEKAF